MVSDNTYGYYWANAPSYINPDNDELFKYQGSMCSVSVYNPNDSLSTNVGINDTQATSLGALIRCQKENSVVLRP